LQLLKADGEHRWGTSYVFKTTDNMFGWTDENGEYMAFDKASTGILCVSQDIKDKYLTPDGQYFEGYTIEDINKHYNGRPEWAEVVNEIYLMIGG